MPERATIDFGIDLGTTNSAVAVFADGQVEVIKNNDNQELTPSAVLISAGGAESVGRRAYERLTVFEDQNARSGFKRQMGKQTRYLFPAAAIERTAEELSASILKELRAAAEMWAGGPVTAAVITVPANFELAQTEATQRAARLAGVRQAPLLQEPIAAGLAYGYQRQLGDGLFMVFDLGGGTLDVSLLRISDGLLTFVDQEGDNFLGGRDWDRKLAEYLFDRLIEAGYNMPSRGQRQGTSGFGRALGIAEEAKIRLSRVEATDVIFDGRFADLDGRPVEATIGLTRNNYEDLISAEVAKAAHFTRSLLQRQKIDPSAVARLVLVGGPTLTPLVRSVLTGELGITLDTRIDPMTVVARGAAIFAASVPIEGFGTSTKTNDASIQLKLAHPAVTGDTEAMVGGRADGPVQLGAQLELRRTDGGWSSGRIALGAGAAFSLRVVLAPRLTNVFDVRAFDDTGGRLTVNPERFAITQGLAAADPPLSRTIWLVGLDPETGLAAQQVMLRKGTALPAVRQITVKSAHQVRPGLDADALNIYVVEGEHDRQDLNRRVGRLQLTGAAVSRALPESTPIDVKIRVDASRGIVASAYVPLLDLTIEDVLRDKYLPDVDAQSLLEDLDRELERASEVAAGRTEVLQSLQQEGADLREEIEAARSSQEQADRADRNLRELIASIDRLAKETELERLAGRVKAELEWARKIAEASDDAALRQRLPALEQEAASAVASRDPERMTSAIGALDRYYWAVATSLPSFWVEHFIAMQDVVAKSSRAQTAAPLLQAGRVALDRQDLDELKRVCGALWKLLPRQEQAASGLRDIGIRF
jgi:molecular chaperone DnaK